MATSFLLVTVWAKQVPFLFCKMLNSELLRHTSTTTTTTSQAYYYKSDGPILPAPWGILVMHWRWNTVCSSWVFSNAEAHWSIHDSHYNFKTHRFDGSNANY